MGVIAIAANPASGRDIRRLVSHATVYDNREKANIVERIILAAYQMGHHTSCIMPDSYGFGVRIIRRLVEDLLELPPEAIVIPELTTMDSQTDTTQFARYAEKQGCKVLVVLGGDGTSRAAAKGVQDIPFIPLSTGTNNAYPDMVEGTIAGMAASALADGVVSPEQCCQKSKRIEVYRNGELVDIALIDAVFCPIVYSGAKAIWERDEILQVVVTQCHPASIGFSALLGGLVTVSPEDDFGATAKSTTGEPNVRAAIGAGVISGFRMEAQSLVPLNQPLHYEMPYSGMVALDGEREVPYRKGDTITLVLTRNGPNRVNIRRALSLAQRAGYFKT